VTTSLACLALVLLSAGPVDASATGDADQGGIQITWTKAELARASMGQDPATGKPDKRSFAYTSAVACQFSTPGGSSADTLCAAAVAACAGNTPAQGQGPQVRVYRRELDTDGLPDPDLLIRTSGELRVSNFLLWQLAYAEFWVTDTLWPDFRSKHLYQAVHDFQHRSRRFGRAG